MTADDGTVFVVSTVPRSESQAGERALAAVRPESFTLVADATQATHANVLAGKVAGVSHFGDTLQYVVRTRLRDVIVLLPRQKAPKPASRRRRVVPVGSGRRVSVLGRQADLVLAEPSAEVAI